MIYEGVEIKIFLTEEEYDRLFNQKFLDETNKKYVKPEEATEWINKLTLGEITESLDIANRIKHVLENNFDNNLLLCKVYGTLGNINFLIGEFEKLKKNDLNHFCKSMFETYYSSKEISEEKVVFLANLYAGTYSVTITDASRNKIPKFDRKKR